MSIGNISNLPRSIAIDSTKVEKSENGAKLPIGPTSPNPGPILLKHAATAVNVVSKSKDSKDIIRNILKIQTIYTAK